MKTNQKTKTLVTLGLLTAVLLLLSCTPLGYLKIGPLEATVNVIPLAIAAIALGAKGGAIIGGVFGLTSFLQCLGIGGVSPLGATLFGINPILTFILCFVPRVLDGFFVGYIFTKLEKSINKSLACAIFGFLTAFLNTVFFMSALVLLFGRTEYMQGLINGQNIILFICTFVGVNAIFEILIATVITLAVGKAMIKMNLIHTA